jgi:endonuclease/exonuclease/phosphatase family metal-dependent hydrolase
MTRNLYVGADITRPIRAGLAITDPRQQFLALGRTAFQLRQTVDATDFSTRSRLLADEIASTRPDVVGLQEVALWRHGPLQLQQVGVPNATTVDEDFLATLLSDLEAAGAAYAVASTQTETDVEVPAFSGNPQSPGPGARDLRLTVSDVVLVRQHAGLRVLAHGGGQYQHGVDLSVGGVALGIIRGYAWADVRFGRGVTRFVTTHLESQSSDLALAQAAELLGSPALQAPRVILACDCNSNPLRAGVRPGDTVPHFAAYRLLTGSGHFTDAWLRQRHEPSPGYTSGLSELVNDPEPTFTARIDLILARSESGGIRARRGQVTGDEVRDRDPETGLWPSDHAGVVLRLRFT